MGKAVLKERLNSGLANLQNMAQEELIPNHLTLSKLYPVQVTDVWNVTFERV